MKRWVLAVVAGAGGFAPVAFADSIWERRDPRYAFLFQDNRARQVGDVLTVVVSETTVTNEQDQRALTRNTNSSGQVSLFGFGTTSAGGGTGGGAAAGTPAAGVLIPFPAETSNRTFSGNATLNTNRVFTDRLAVTVVDIMPNGNLVVEGYRSRVVQGEERVLRITGVVRQQDVGIGSSVQSQAVANFRISYLGRGPATRATKPGLLGRVQSLLTPF